MIKYKYKYKLKYMDEFNIVVMDFDEEKSLEFGNMISDPLGSEGVIAREEAEIAMNGIEQK
jgi:hypothetical protein